jgi:hypothetical protein
MTYVLEALVGRNEINSVVLSQLPSSKLIALHQDVWLLPLTNKLVSEISQLPFNKTEKFLLPPELKSVSANVILLAEQLSQNNKVAYLEAEFFGGIGEQVSAGWQDQKMVFHPRQSITAINQALQWLGVLRDNEHDEFDMIGLGQHRNTEAWAQQ